MSYQKPLLRKLSKPIFLFYLPIGILSIFVLFPLYWLVATSLKETHEIFSIPQTWFPQTLSTDAYKKRFFFALYYL